ncbi:MAG: molybdopterin-dependent oxidoreductase [Eggerthellaceae bacterium]|nr:molybdopterin-dependent oxidoreductase [Eggerthellaceae bacterium]
MKKEQAEALSTENDLWLRTNCWSPPGCHPTSCGLYCHIVDGKLVGVEGDEDHPVSQGRVCARALAVDEVQYHKDRVLHPMKRAREDRGLDKWEQITWDEAFDLIERESKRIQKEYGPESIVVFNGTGRECAMWSYPMCFAAFQSSNSCFAMSGYSCYGPRNAISFYILGAGYPEIDYAAYFPERYDYEEYEVPKYMIIWGKYPLISNPDGLYGHAIVDLMKRGTKLISVDPRVTWLASRSEYHIQLRPGTDAAVALAMLHVIIYEDLYDHEFVEKWTHGFDQLKERVAEWTPEAAAEICWCSAEVIRGAARAFATNGPSTIAWGLAFDTSSNGVQAGQAVLSIAAICGYIDVPGGVTIGAKEVFLGKWWTDSTAEVDPEVWSRRLGAAEFPGYAAAQTHAQSDRVLDALETSYPYPIRMAYYHGTNFLANSAAHAPHRWYEALLRETEFSICSDIFMTPTAMGLADVFLPCATMFEHNGVVMPHFGRNMHSLGMMDKMLDPGDTKSDLDVMIEIGKRLNPDAWPWKDGDDFFDDWLTRFYPFDLDGLRQIGSYQPGYTYRKYETGGLRDDGQPGFNTPTGKVELYSTLYEIFGEDPLPYFEEPHYSPYSKPEMAAVYPLVLTTGARKWGSFHSEHRQVETLRDIDPDPILEISPADAERYGLKTGDWAAIENPFGRAVERVKVTPGIMEGVVHAQHGWWFPEDEAEAPSLYGVWKSSVNSLIPHNEMGKLGFGAPFKNVICKVYRVESHDA